MGRCAKGHAQRTGLACGTCGGPVSYRDDCRELLKLPAVSPDYGRLSVVSVNLPRVEGAADWSGTLSLGEVDAQDSSSFTAAKIKGGNWLDFRSRYSKPVARWMRLMGFDRSAHRVLVMDTTSPLSVAAASALPPQGGTLVIATTAERDSTPIEQNASYAAVSAVLGRGLPLIAVDRGYMRDLLLFVEGRGIVAQEGAMAYLVASLLEASEDVVDLVERDLRLGVQVHCLSPLVAGSKSVYKGPSEAFLAQEENLSIEAGAEEVRTVYPVVFAQKDVFPEFEKSFSAYRNKRFKGAISAECRFRERRGAMPLYDMLVLYGLNAETATRAMAEGYGTVLKSVPELKAEGPG